MKIEYLESGSSDCPLIRLFEFDYLEVIKLRECLQALIQHKVKILHLDQQDFIITINNCRLAFEISEGDRGLQKKADFIFSCRLTEVSYQNIVGLLDPFCVKPMQTSENYQWLNDTGDIALLLSPSGSW